MILFYFMTIANPQIILAQQEAKITKNLLYAYWGKAFKTNFPRIHMQENGIVITSILRRKQKDSKRSAHYSGHAIDISSKKEFFPLLFMFFDRNFYDKNVRMGIDMSKNQKMRHIHFERRKLYPYRFIEKNKKFHQTLTNKNYPKLKEKIKLKYIYKKKHFQKISLVVVSIFLLITLLKKKKKEALLKPENFKNFEQYQKFKAFQKYRGINND